MPDIEEKVPVPSKTKRLASAAKNPWAGVVAAVLAAVTSFVKTELEQAKNQHASQALSENQHGLAKAHDGLNGALLDLYQHEVEARTSLELRLVRLEAQEALRAGVPVPVVPKSDTAPIGAAKIDATKVPKVVKVEVPKVVATAPLKSAPIKAEPVPAPKEDLSLRDAFKARLLQKAPPMKGLLP